MARKIPYDIVARNLRPRSRGGAGADPAAPGAESGLGDMQRVIEGLSRIALMNGYGQLVAVYSITVTQMDATLIKENRIGEDTRLLEIRNDDTGGANRLMIAITTQAFSAVQAGAQPDGFPIPAGESYRLVVVPGMKVYAIGDGGSIKVRILEFVGVPL